MMRVRLRACGARQDGFTLIELLVAIMIIGVLAGIALAVFLGQSSKANDVSTKSNVANVSRLLQACVTSSNTRDDYRDCDSGSKLGETAPPLDPTPADESGDCNPPASGDTISDPDKTRILRASSDCFVVFGESRSGNRFWYIRRSDGSARRGCDAAGRDGCDADGSWGG
jgi:prepilin-type N-terminal cleavage/methylation domain-containing protein